MRTRLHAAAVLAVIVTMAGISLAADLPPHNTRGDPARGGAAVMPVEPEAKVTSAKRAPPCLGG